jgi:hypothetical protein
VVREKCITSILLALPAEARRLGATLSRHAAQALAFMVLMAWAVCFDVPMARVCAASGFAPGTP